MKRFPTHLLSVASRWAILGNSGSGKSTLARWIGAQTGATVMDLDTLAWRRDCRDPVLRPVDEAVAELDSALSTPSWVVEGCYEDLIEALAPREPMLIWLDVSEEVCAERVRARAFEPHKYPTPEAQVAAQEPLIEWIRGYRRRRGPLSHAAHEALFTRWPGPKRRLGAEAGGSNATDDPMGGY